MLNCCRLSIESCCSSHTEAGPCNEGENREGDNPNKGDSRRKGGSRGTRKTDPAIAATDRQQWPDTLPQIPRVMSPSHGHLGRDRPSRFTGWKPVLQMPVQRSTAILRLVGSNSISACRLAHIPHHRRTGIPVCPSCLGHFADRQECLSSSQTVVDSTRTVRNTGRSAKDGGPSRSVAATLWPSPERPAATPRRPVRPSPERLFR
jgi:hypothetical protein